jgi:hypothetical protein
MPESDGIIHSFQLRRQLEQDLESLAATNSQNALTQGVQRLVEHYSADVLLAAVLRHLGTSNSQLRGGLGQLCEVLPVDVTVAALQGVAGNRGKTPQERTTAALILDRYLDQPVAGALMADLAGADEVPYQSLLEAIEEARQNRHVLLEYVTQMQEHPVDTAFMVLRLVDRLRPDDRAELLRLIAQDVRPQVAHAAMDRLAAAAGEPGGEGCLRSLHTLLFALEPDNATLAERYLRKLQFGGKRYQPPPDVGWQALLGPSDASGYLSVWFVRHASDADGAGPDNAPDIPATGSHATGSYAGHVWLGFILSVQGGILQFSGSEDMPRAYLPQQATTGELVTVRTSGGQNTVLLCAPFDVGRWLVRQALDARWRQSTGQPASQTGSQSGGQPAGDTLPGEYTLYNDLLWQFAAPKLPTDLAEWWERSGVTSGGAVDNALDASKVNEAAGILVDDPAMEGWVRWSAAMWHNVKYRSQQQPAVPPGTLVSLLLRELGRMPDHRTLLKAMVAGLRVQTLWYAIAGSPANAGRAALLARATAILPITDNPLVAGLLQKGLGV